MTQNAALARIFGSDSDSIYLAPVGSTLPTTITGSIDPAFEDMGWLHSDGITETPTGSKTLIRGHQGQRVVRTRMTEPGTTIKFVALESKPQTQALRYVEKGVTTTAGVRKTTRGAGQVVSRRAAVVDLFDADDITVKERWCFPVIEITPDGDRVFGANDISGFPFLAEVTADYTHFQTVGTADTTWDVTVTGTPTGGTYALIVNGVATAPIAYNANAATVAAAINAISGVTGVSGVTASGTTPIAIVFPVPVTLGYNNALTGGTAPALTIV